MGNTASYTHTRFSYSPTHPDFKSFAEVIDHIASQYIVTADFQSLQKLGKQKYCEELIQTASRIFEKYHSHNDLLWLKHRTLHGTDQASRDATSVSHLTNAQQNQVRAAMTDPDAKKTLCLEIAQFYVKVAHIFAAIITTINPQYEYTDSKGRKQRVNYRKKADIPSNTRVRVVRSNICDSRIHALSNKMDVDPVKKTTTLQPAVCGVGSDPKKLSDEPGITELAQLYFDDDFDIAHARFRAMSASSREKYRSDLRAFYSAFTGEPIMPEHIQHFSDIKLRHYRVPNHCTGKSETWKQPVKGETSSPLFRAYADHLQTMIGHAVSNQRKLLAVLNRLFLWRQMPGSARRVVTIHPELSSRSLSACVEETREFIKKLYTQCERDYLEGIKIFEGIVETKIADTTHAQVKTLRAKANQILKKSKASSSRGATSSATTSTATDKKRDKKHNRDRGRHKKHDSRDDSSSDSSSDSDDSSEGKSKKKRKRHGTTLGKLDKMEKQLLEQQKKIQNLKVDETKPAVAANALQSELVVDPFTGALVSQRPATHVRAAAAKDAIQLHPADLEWYANAINDDFWKDSPEEIALA